MHHHAECFNGCRCPSTIEDCIRCPWFINDRERVLIYTANELISGTGTISSSPSSTETVIVEFLLTETAIKTIQLSIGQCVGFTVTGFTQIRLKGMAECGNASGELCFIVRFSSC